MRGLAILPVLVLAAACADRGITEPVDVPPGDVAAAAVPNPAQGGWEVHFTTTLIGAVDLGTTRIAGHNLIGKGVVNAMAMTGDLEGTLYYGGQFQLSLKTGAGGGIGHDVVMDITSPGTGSFVCQSKNWIEDYFGAVIQKGIVYSCEGSGDYDGKKMKGSSTNEANPGLFIYENWGVIY